jgi:hypothetical protein
MSKEYSDYIIYVDESGDHGMSNINKYYPVFVLAFCIFKKTDYLQTVVNMQQFKFERFGHDMVILHESEIRRNRGDFAQFNKIQKQDFMDELTDLIKQENFTIVASVIDKNKMLEKYTHLRNPYYVAMGFCLERLYLFLKKNNATNKIIHIVFEQRGRQEDKELELEFRRWCDGDNYFKKRIDFNIRMASKQNNSVGLQLADLIARPIGLSVLKPEQKNKAFKVIKDKFRKYNGRYKGSGLKIFPD